MQEKEMISDYLAGINASLAGYGGIISQCENQELRETIQSMRNQDEVRQYALFKIAKEKGLDTSLLEDIDFSKQNAETITTIIDTKKQVFDKALEKAINERYKEKTPENVSSSSPSTKELPMFF